jgi:hypothetical protein
MNPIAPIIAKLYGLVPASLFNRSGKVFYSGRQAFSTPAKLYVIGLNPGGDPLANASETVEVHSAAVLRSLPPDCSAFRDKSWEGSAAGTWQMQPRVLHMFRSLRLNSGAVPCSNLVFVRSRDEAALQAELPSLLDLCWPFHAGVLEHLRPQVVVCFGQTAGEHFRQRVGATELTGQFVERNKRRWTSTLCRAPSGLRIVVVTHPSRVKWQEPASDPTSLVAAALNDA